MSSNTVFGAIAQKLLANRYEDVATEALAHIVGKSQVAAGVLSGLLSEIGVCLPKTISYQPQYETGSGCTPDIAALGSDRKPVAFVENKFWAGLTEKQPVAYLKELGGAGAILFVVPEARIALIWRELQSRCTQADLVLTPIEKKPQVEIAILSNGQRLAVISWRALLQQMEDSLNRCGERNAANDVEQLRGLCEVMDSDAFLPLRADELTNLELPRRWLNYIQLAEDIAQQSILQKVCDQIGSGKTAWSYGAVGRWLRLGRHPIYLAADAYLWKRYGLSPVWVWFDEKETTAEMQDRLRAEGSPFRERCFVEEGKVVTPIILPTGVVKDVVVGDAVRQLAKLRDTCCSVTSPQAVDSSA